MTANLMTWKQHADTSTTDGQRPFVFLMIIGHGAYLTQPGDASIPITFRAPTTTHLHSFAPFGDSCWYAYDDLQRMFAALKYNARLPSEATPAFGDRFEQIVMHAQAQISATGLYMSDAWAGTFHGHRQQDSDRTVTVAQGNEYIDKQYSGDRGKEWCGVHLVHTNLPRVMPQWHHSPLAAGQYVRLSEILTEWARRGVSEVFVFDATCSRLLEAETHDPVSARAVRALSRSVRTDARLMRRGGHRRRRPRRHGRGACATRRVRGGRWTPRRGRGSTRSRRGRR